MLESTYADKGNRLTEVFFFFLFHPRGFDPKIKRMLETNVSFLAGVCNYPRCPGLVPISLTVCISALKADSLKGLLSVLRPAHGQAWTLRMERVFFEFKDNPDDRVATQAERASKLCVICYPGNTLNLFPWFCPLAILRSCFPSMLSVGCRMNMFKGKSALGWVSFHCPNARSLVGLCGFISFLYCMHMKYSFFATWYLNI